MRSIYPDLVELVRLVLEKSKNLSHACHQLIHHETSMFLVIIPTAFLDASTLDLGQTEGSLPFSISDCIAVERY